MRGLPGCLLLSVTWCRVPPGEFSLVQLNPRILVSGSSETTAHQPPLRLGDSPYPLIFNKKKRKITIINNLKRDQSNILFQ